MRSADVRIIKRHIERIGRRVIKSIADGRGIGRSYGMGSLGEKEVLLDGHKGLIGSIELVRIIRMIRMIKMIKRLMLLDETGQAVMEGCPGYR
ncbi:hypothetical protein PRECH8_24620 [Insulibacter thermoxylanivorax]|uniref:Uncharacterized protein n=1 Tax=Insulibacter thermoxylanivorax TaxID=2749268 RepID=A0A916QIJ1_9BACL|nr:hypothetical protein PRECH8_24620 [Insulibacter thermoxylanivorax]